MSARKTTRTKAFEAALLDMERLRTERDEAVRLATDAAEKRAAADGEIVDLKERLREANTGAERASARARSAEQDARDWRFVALGLAVKAQAGRAS